ncbi:peptidoglycan DD-metalloendopeptidase family protein [Senegalia massiliensis]|uniref:Peptidoglycan DD-metalloendopeptidase family protein n=1 Tax=Senegalia massiliensis TaxID=1720316 RepID=A0A845QSK7_9CLOT|nr:hypothetical protein [Senegalia massiliensis]
MNFRKISAVLCAAILLNASFVYADVDSKKGDLNKTQQEMNKVKDDLNNTKKEKKSVEGELKELESKISNASSDISSLENNISNVRTNIENSKKEIEESQKSIDAKNELVNKRLRAMYKNGNNVSYLHILLSAESIGEFIETFDTIRKVTDNDHELLKEMEKEKKIVEAKKDKLVSQEKQLKLQTVKLKEKKQELELASRSKNEIVKELDQSIQVSEEQYKELQEDSQKIAQEIRSLEEEARRKLEAKKKAEEEARRKAEQEQANKENQGNQGNDNSSNTNSKPPVESTRAYKWPVPGHNRVTSPFGNRTHPIFGTVRMHTGIDIGAPSGSTVVATRDGIVLSSGWKGGYGKTVMVTHDNGTTSLYAHNSSLLVSPGQFVRQGQAIARIGSTGNSTGPHLHFEIRVNGNYRNPLSYVR